MQEPSIPGTFLLAGLHRTWAESSPSWQAAHLLREGHTAPAGAHPRSSLTSAPSRDPFFQQKQVCEREPGRGSPGMGLVASSPAQGTGPWGSPQKARCPRRRGNPPRAFPGGPAAEKSMCCRSPFQKMDLLLWADWFHLIPFRNNVSRGPVVSPWKGTRNLTGCQASAHRGWLAPGSPATNGRARTPTSQWKTSCPCTQN